MNRQISHNWQEVDGLCWKYTKESNNYNSHSLKRVLYHHYNKITMKVMWTGSYKIVLDLVVYNHHDNHNHISIIINTKISPNHI